MNGQRAPDEIGLEAIQRVGSTPTTAITFPFEISVVCQDFPQSVQILQVGQIRRLAAICGH